jgi:catechol 2,3-dioxygenase-like lactoylglutathione lyase family enzyme
MSTPFAIRGIDHLVLRVRDVPKVQAFYVGVLGCSVEKVQADIGLVQLRAGRSLIDLVGVDGKLGRMGGAAPGREGRNLDHLCLRIEPFAGEAIRAHLQAAGADPGPVESRYGADGQGPSIYLHDPEGNMVELKGPPWPDIPLAADAPLRQISLDELKQIEAQEESGTPRWDLPPEVRRCGGQS